MTRKVQLRKPAADYSRAGAARAYSPFERAQLKGMSRGYAPLGDEGRIGATHLGTGAADSSTVLFGDGTYKPPGAGSINIQQVEIDFGATPVEEAEFVVADASVGAGSQLLGLVAYEAPTGKDLDEVEMDALDLKFAPGSAQFTLRVRGLDGPVHDKFKINYLVG